MPDSRDPNELVVFARHPTPGLVKTRLAASIGDPAACDLYRSFLEDLAERLGHDPRWRFTWAFTPEGSPFAEEVSRGLPCVPQSAGGLGERLEAAFQAARRRGARRIAVIGSDLPQLDPETVAEAFEALGHGRDLVLGPADDGGYYLIAARETPRVFDGVAWSGPEVLERTLEHARRERLDTHLLPTAFDVDDATGLERLRQWVEGAPGALPSTERQLAIVRG